MNTATSKGEMLKEAKSYTKALGHPEGMGFWDAVDCIENRLVADPANDLKPMTEISNMAQEIAGQYYEDRG